MKKIISCLFLLGFFIASCNLPVTQSAIEPGVTEIQSELEPALPPENTPLPAEINAPIIDSPSIIFIEMLDEIYGWGVTETQIIRTNDGGVTWYNVTPAGLTETGYSVDREFLDASHAWIQAADPNNFPNGGTLYHTSDGGITWTSYATPFSGGGMKFVDANNGWIMADLGVGAGSMAISVFQTNDGGATWNRTYTNDPNLNNAGDTLPLGGIKRMIAPLNMQTAWIGGVIYSTGTVYLFRTDDGGKTWFKINIPLSEEAQTGELSVEKIQFVSPTQGFLVVRLASAEMQTLIYTTDDGGSTWTPAPVNLAGAGPLEILSAQEMIFYSSDQFYVTKDAANTFSAITPDIAFGESLSGMSFANSFTGWVVTTDPSSNHRALYKTTDGGLTWFPIIP